MLLDTSFLIDVMKGHEAAVARAKAIQREGAGARIPTPALFELWRGVHLAARTSDEERKVLGLLGVYPWAPLDGDGAAQAGEVDAALLRRGDQIDPEDSMIAGIALARGEPILTRDARHFGRIPGLQVETY